MAITEAGSSEEKIVKAAEQLFFEKGYEGTSMRMIAERANCAIGLAYHYFPSKDQLLEAVVERFLDGYHRLMEEFMEDASISPRMRLYQFFQLVEKEVDKFRDKYEGVLHWTIRLSIRERALQSMEPYVRAILEKNLEDGMPSLPVSVPVLATMLTHSLGSIILHEDRTAYKRASMEIRTEVNLMMGRPANAEVFAAGTDEPGGDR